MANFGFSLRSTFGLIPKTDKIEEERNQLEDEFNRLNAFKESELLAEYTELENYIGSSDFIDFKKEILGLDFKKSDEYKKEQRFAKLKKDKRIVNYYRVLNSEPYKKFIDIEQSELLVEYEKLSNLVGTEGHINIKKQLAQTLAIEIQKKKDFEKQQKSKIVKNYFKVLSSNLYQTFTELDGSDKIAEYEELKQLAANKQLEEEEQKTKYKTLKADTRIKSYYKFKKSKQLALFNQFHNSSELESYNELKNYIESDDYKTNLENAKFENSEAYKNEQRLKELKSNENIKHWLKFKKAKNFLLFQEIENSELLNEYIKLEELVNSDKFKEFKAYMLDKDKFTKTEEFEKEQRFNELKNNDEIKWYFKTKDSNKFDELKQWKITFEDRFEETKINDQLWMNSFFWGKMLLNDRYVMAGDKQYYTDNKNLDLSNNTLKIVTKNEDTEGRVWHPTHGFSTQNFDYTSGMLSTAHSFRQQYGKFEAKIKIDNQNPVYQAFWLKGEKILPEIDIFKFNFEKANKMHMNSFVGDPNKVKEAKPSSTKLNGSAFSKDFFIYSLEWTSENITWKINDIEVYSTNSNIPEEPLYILISAGVHRDPKGEQINSAYEIDWIRCYEKADLAG